MLTYEALDYHHGCQLAVLCLQRRQPLRCIDVFSMPWWLRPAVVGCRALQSPAGSTSQLLGVVSNVAKAAFVAAG